MRTKKLINTICVLACVISTPLLKADVGSFLLTSTLQCESDKRLTIINTDGNTQAGCSYDLAPDTSTVITSIAILEIILIVDDFNT